MISRDMVLILQLAPKIQHNPHTIGWVKEVGRNLSTKRCEVAFSIGKYFDEVYCDVIDMEGYHIQFGKP